MSLATLFSVLKENMPGKHFRWIFLGADLYGTRINGLKREVVTEYFKSIARWLSCIIPEAEWILWSDYDVQAEVYRQETRRLFHRLFKPSFLLRVQKVVRAMGNKSATPYLVERYSEAMLMEEQYRPIKISCVGRHKDNMVDCSLPRLYLLPEHLHAPWM